MRLSILNSILSVRNVSVGASQSKLTGFSNHSAGAVHGCRLDNEERGGEVYLPRAKNLQKYHFYSIVFL